MPSFAATVHTDIAAEQPSVFRHIAPIELASIFTGYGPLPSVTGTRNQTGAWDAAGQTRTVMLSDGSSARERITKYEFPRYFSYTVSDFTGALRLVTSSANGEWWFDASPSSRGTGVKWRYAFNSRRADSLVDRQPPLARLHAQSANAGQSSGGNQGPRLIPRRSASQPELELLQRL